LLESFSQPAATPVGTRCQTSRLPPGDSRAPTSPATALTGST